MIIVLKKYNDQAKIDFSALESLCCEEIGFKIFHLAQFDIFLIV